MRGSAAAATASSVVPALPSVRGGRGRGRARERRSAGRQRGARGQRRRGSRRRREGRRGGGVRRGRGRGAGVAAAAAAAATEAVVFVKPRSSGGGGGVPPVRRWRFRHGGQGGGVVRGITAIVTRAKAAALRGGYASSLVAKGRRAQFFMPESGWETRECCRAEHQARGRGAG